MKIKMIGTNATTAVIYNDNTNNIVTLETIGRLKLSSAKKFFKNNHNVANVKTLEVIAVEYSEILYEIDDTKLLEFLKQNGTLINNDVSNNDNDVSETQ